jgi:lysophospholipase L1-like esterase
MVLGDSVTFGVGVNNGETYPDQLGKILGDEFSVLNFGVGGWGFAEYFLVFQKYFEEKTPELVIIGIHTGNDFEDLAYADWEGKENGDLPNPPLKRNDIFIDEEGIMWTANSIHRIPLLKSVALAVFFEKTFRTPFNRFLTTIVFDSLNWLSKEEMSLKIISYIAAKSSNLLVVILPPQFHYPKINSFTSYVEKLESLDGARVLDFYPILEENYKIIYIDGSHFNPEGNKIVAQEIANFILKNNLL